MKFFDSKRNRVIIASVVLLVVVVVTAIVSFSTDTLPDYEIVETDGLFHPGPNPAFADHSPHPVTLVSAGFLPRWN